MRGILRSANRGHQVSPTIPCPADPCADTTSLCQQNPTNSTLCTRICRAGMYARVVDCLDCLVATGVPGIDADEAQRAQLVVRNMCDDLGFRTLPLQLQETGAVTR